MNAKELEDKMIKEGMSDIQKLCMSTYKHSYKTASLKELLEEMSWSCNCQNCSTLDYWQTVYLKEEVFRRLGLDID